MTFYLLDLSIINHYLDLQCKSTDIKKEPIKAPFYLLRILNFTQQRQLLKQLQLELDQNLQIQ